jgi:pimeloyl-ACP methyl ester carboxylesterase
MATLHVLNFRYSDFNGSPRSEPETTPEARNALQTAHRCVVFIHGFANSPGAAEPKYRLKMAQLQAAFSGGVGPDERTEYFALFWPGSHRLIGEDQATFAVRVPAASATGTHLALALIDLRTAGEVVLVAHSLGCRVALACLEQLSSRQANGWPVPTVSAAVLMAGAVPVAECEIGPEVFGRRFGGTYYVNIYSLADGTLKKFFPIGQQLVDRRATAIGLSGGPYEGQRWDVPMRTTLDHSDYWESDETGEAAALAAGAVATSHVRTHTMAEHHPSDAELQTSHTPERRALID